MINDGLIPKPKLRIDKSGTTISCRELSAYNFSDILSEFGDGESSTDHSPDHTYGKMETYEVCYTATSDFGVKVRQCMLVDLATSIQQIDENMAWSVYPNPAGSKVICSGFSTEAGNMDLSLLNVSGELVESIYSNRVEEGAYHLEFNLAETPPGLYLLQIISGHSLQVEKLVVQ